MDLDEVAEMISLAAEEANDEVRERDRPSGEWLKSFKNKLQMALEERL